MGVASQTTLLLSLSVDSRGRTQRGTSVLKTSLQSAAQRFQSQLNIHKVIQEGEDVSTSILNGLLRDIERNQMRRTKQQDGWMFTGLLNMFIIHTSHLNRQDWITIYPIKI